MAARSSQQGNGGGVNRIRAIARQLATLRSGDRSASPSPSILSHPSRVLACVTRCPTAPADGIPYTVATHRAASCCSTCCWAAFLRDGWDGVCDSRCILGDSSSGSSRSSGGGGGGPATVASIPRLLEELISISSDNVSTQVGIVIPAAVADRDQPSEPAKRLCWLCQMHLQLTRHAPPPRTASRTLT